VPLPLCDIASAFGGSAYQFHEIALRFFQHPLVVRLCPREGNEAPSEGDAGEREGGVIPSGGDAREREGGVIASGGDGGGREGNVIPSGGDAAEREGNDTDLRVHVDDPVKAAYCGFGDCG